jgi:hypothetical protein
LKLISRMQIPPVGSARQHPSIQQAASRPAGRRRESFASPPLAERRRPSFSEFHLIGMRWRIEFRLLADYISGKLSVAESTEACLEIRGLRRASE